MVFRTPARQIQGTDLECGRIRFCPGTRSIAAGWRTSACFARVPVMDRTSVEQLLRSSLHDGRLSRAEKAVLKSMLPSGRADAHEHDWIRHRAFHIAQELLPGSPGNGVVAWLEDVVGLLVAAERTTDRSRDEYVSEAHFCPGKACLYRIQDLLREAVSNIDICVFTITDDRLSDSIVDAHARGVQVRVISDNDKAHDPGSDLSRLRRLDIPVVFDQTPDHMHHKFAVFDNRLLVTGSYNWTRSATDRNEENIVVSGDTRLVTAFQQRFQQLWQELSS